MKRIWFLLITILFVAGCGATAVSPTPTPSPSPAPTLTPTPDLATHDRDLTAELLSERDPEVPELPFPDNPDPSQCGIPIQWGDDGAAWLTGYYDEELVQPTVFLYDSHLRLNITAQAPHGTKVKVILYQQNPVTDYYFVKIEGADQPNEGWVPGPFLSFDPVSPVDA